MSLLFKKICWTCVLITCGISLMVWLLTSCKQNYKELQEIPPVVYSSGDDVNRRDLAYHFGYQRGYNSVNIDVPVDVNIYLLDSRFKPVDYYWFRKFNNWFRELLFENGIMSLGGANESHDCDNFAMLYKSMMSVAGFKSNSKIEPASGLITVQQVNEFGGIPGTGGLHMLILVMTNQGWYVVEPQTGDFILLEDYPNQQHIKMFIF